MATLNLVSLAFLLSACLAEPPVQSGNFGGYNYPAPTYSKPSTNYGAPANTYKPSPTYHAPINSYNPRPSSTYSPPSNSYNVPKQTYHAPTYTPPSSNYNVPTSNYVSPTASNYNLPSNSYAPVPTYIAPSNNYKAPSYNTAPSTNYNQGYANPSNSLTAPGTSYGTPSASGSGYNSQHDHHDHHSGQDEYNEPKSYEFGYAVKDPYTGNDYGRKETSDGNTVQGEYRVQLPDGRTQIVTYHADWKTGFHADVRYEGEAKYPETSGYTGPKNQFGASGYPSSMYGAPAAGNFNQVQPSYSPPPSVPTNQYQQQADYSGSSGFGSSGKYDSYAPQGSFGSKAPSTAYGTPAFH